MHLSDESSARANILTVALAIFALSLAAYVLATTLQAVVDTYTALPFWDAWGEVTVSQHIEKFFHEHNEHRIAVARLVFIADKLLSHGDNKLTLTVLLLLQAGNAMLLVWLFRQALTRRLEAAAAMAAIALAVGMAFWLAQYETFTWPFEVQVVGVSSFANASFALFALNPRRYAAVLAMLLAGLASLCMANGILAPLLLVTLAVWLRRPWIDVALLAVLAAAIFAGYFTGYQLQKSGPVSGTELEVVWQTVRYGLAYLGGPFAMGAQAMAEKLSVSIAPVEDVAVWIGAAGLVLFTGLGVYLLCRPTEALPARLALLYVAAFVVATMPLTAIGRIQFGVAQALSSRYATTVALFWTALAFLLASLRSDVREGAKLAALSALILFLAFLARTQENFVATVHQNALDRRPAESAILSEVEDQDYMLRVFPQWQLVRDQAKLMKEARFSIFARPWSHWLGSPLGAHVRIAAAGRCTGYLDEISEIAPDKGSGWRARGWAFDNKRSSVPLVILLAQADGTIVGYGLPGYPRPDVVQALRNDAMLDSGWLGSFDVREWSAITAYAIFEGTDEACRLVNDKYAHGNNDAGP